VMQSDLDKWTKELRKGTTKLAILSLLRVRDMYGYELTKDLGQISHGVISLKEGNAYAALHTMETDSLITSYWKETGPGMPPRKYYSITPQGRTFFEEMRNEWQKQNEAMDLIWEYSG
jgi:PadR family transcriptional regulator PadR